MLWFYAALMASLGFAITVLVSKHIMQDISSFNFAATYSILAPLFYLPVFLYFLNQFSVEAGMMAWLAVLLSGGANTLAIIVSSKAIKHGEVSTVTPLIRLQPVFAAIIGILILGELASLEKMAGVILTTAGGYVVLLKKQESFVEPLVHLKTSIPAQLSVLTAFLYASGAVADRFATQQIQPEIYNFLLLSIMGASFALYLGFKERHKIQQIREGFSENRLAYIVVGLVTAVAYFSMVKALSIAEASKVVPVVQAQVLFVVAGGWIIFNEKGVFRKLVGSILLVSGVIFIAAPSLVPL